jgi:hypothetical protein
MKRGKQKKERDNLSEPAETIRRKHGNGKGRRAETRKK